MKRSGIQRKTGLNRGTSQLKRTELKPGKPPQRKKAMKRSGKIKPKPPRYPPRALIKLRKAWESEQSNCHLCGAWSGRETHHIEFKSQAPGRFEHASNWLWICRECHSYLHNHGGNEHAKLLECKRQADPENYSIEAWLTLKPRPASYLEGPKL